MFPDDGHRAPVPRWGWPLLKACSSPEAVTVASTPPREGGDDGQSSGWTLALVTSPYPQSSAREALLRDLEATRHQVAELETLLAELPAIFERKFQQQLQPVQERTRLLAEEHQALREQAHFALQGAAEGQRPELPFPNGLGSWTRKLLKGRSSDSTAA